MKFVSSVVDFVLHKEPAVVLGAVGSVALAAEQVVVQGNAHDWQAAVPLLIAALIRQLVTPAPAP